MPNLESPDGFSIFLSAGGPKNMLDGFFIEDTLLSEPDLLPICLDDC